MVKPYEIQWSNPISNVSQDSPGFLGKLFIFTMWATKKPLLLSSLIGILIIMVYKKQSQKNWEIPYLP